MRFTAMLGWVVVASPVWISADLPEPVPGTPANLALAKYFDRQVREIELDNPLEKIDSAEAWEEAEPTWRTELADMLGLHPMPERTPLKVTMTGEASGDGFTVENLHYQSQPGLYVTGNLYRPTTSNPGKKHPAILYVCGHAKVKEEGVSYGNKTAYHHHGVWFARHGYICLTIDTIQLGEIEGHHHGTHRLNRWWWISRGYTPAGVEAWNGMRGIDYLVSRDDVDADRIGVTGRSGGGAYSWWIAAMDTRVRVAAPTAGITNLRNHVVDGVIEGHCDCMFHVNSRRWDFDRVAALVAPRPLLILNTEKDRIFPIDGVFSVYQSVRRLYEAVGAGDNIGLHVAEGPHKDTQPLNTGAFHWFERHLKGTELTDTHDQAAVKVLAANELKVFETLPGDEIVTRIDETFVNAASPPVVPETEGAMSAMSDRLTHQLQKRVFGGWPRDAAAISPKKINSIDRDGLQMTTFDLESQPGVVLRLYLVHRHGLRPSDLDLVALNVLDDEGWDAFCARFDSRFAKLIEGFPAVEPDEDAFQQELRMHQSFAWGMAYLCPRGTGSDGWSGSEKSAIHRERRFYLLGQTADGMRVWDIRRSIQAMKRISGLKETPLWLQSEGRMAVNTLYASLFEDSVTRLDLHQPTTSHRDGPHYPMVLRHLDVPVAAAMAASRTRCIVYTGTADDWDFPSKVSAQLGWEKRFEVRSPVTSE